MRTLAIAFAAILILGTETWAQETPADWVRKLGNGSYAERERAAKQLEKAGKSALPHLRAAMVQADLETRRRALLLMERIENEVVLDATPIRLRYQEMDLNDALRAVETQIGLQCDRVAGNPRIKRIDTGESPFWQAWGKFCKDAQIEESDFAASAAKLIPMRDGIGEQLRGLLERGEFDINAKFKTPRIPFDPPATGKPYAVDASHSVRVRARWLALDRQIDKAAPHAVFVFELRAEPRLEIVGAPRVELTKIVAEKGTEQPVQTARLLPASLTAREARIASAFAGEVQYGGLLHLKAIPWQAGAAKSIALHGKIHLDIVTRPSLLEMNLLPTSVGKTKHSYDGIALKLLKFDTTDDGDLVVRVHLDHLNSLTPQTVEQRFIRVRPGFIAERSAIDIAMERFELRDAGGRPYAKVKAHYQPSAAGSGYDVELHFTAKTGKHEPTLVLTKAARTVGVSMPFEVRGVACEASRRP